MDHQRHLGLFGATALGVGAIVGGGGILALAGIAFATTGPSTIVAFGLNGAIAFLTAASFAQLARRFTDSGGLYLYARKLLSIEVAIVVAWVVWFASILAGVLYALGFAAFALEGLGRSGAWTQAPAPAVAVAVAATAFYTRARAIDPRTGNCRHDRQGDRLRDHPGRRRLGLDRGSSLHAHDSPPALPPGRHGRTSPGDGLYLHRSPGLRPDRRRRR